MTSFDEFLESGRLGSIEVGIPVAAIVLALGPPEDQALFTADRRILKYGGLQLTISAEVVHVMTLKPLGTGAPWPCTSLACTGWLPWKDISRIAMEEHLAAIGLSPRIDSSLTWNDLQLTTTLESGVRLIYDERECLLCLQVT